MAQNKTMASKAPPAGAAEDTEIMLGLLNAVDADVCIQQMLLILVLGR